MAKKQKFGIIPKKESRFVSFKPLTLFKEGIRTRSDQILLWLSYLIRAIMLISFVSALIHSQWIVAFETFLILLLTLVPSIIQRNYRIYLPIEIELIALTFIFAGFFLGSVHGYYEKLWWWDIMLHSSSGVLFGFAGFLIVNLINYGKKSMIRLSPIFVVIFSFCFALSIGAGWEIIEFTLDSTTGMNMQRLETGVKDTMYDLIVDAAGALLVSLWGYKYTKKPAEQHIIARAVARIVKKNPRVFGTKVKIRG